MGGGLQPPHQMPTSPLVSGHLAGPSVGPVLGALSSHSKHPSRPHRAGLAQAAVQSSSWGCRRPLGPPSAPVLGSLDMGLSVWGSHLPETAVGRTWVLEAVLVPSSHFWARDPSRAGSPHPRRGSGWRQEGFHGRWVRSALGKGQALCFCSGPPRPGVSRPSPLESRSCALCGESPQASLPEARYRSCQAHRAGGEELWEPRTLEGAHGSWAADGSRALGFAGVSPSPTTDFERQVSRTFWAWRETYGLVLETVFRNCYP